MLRRQILTMLLCVALTLIAFGLANADDFYVEVGGTGTGSGWGSANAFGKIQDGVDACPSNNPPDTIHVAAGTYNAASGESFPITIVNKTTGITILGAGIGATILDAEGTSTNKHRVMTISGVTTCAIKQMTVKHGWVEGSGDQDFAGSNGGGIYCYNSTDVLFCTIEVCNNYAKGSFASRHENGYNYNWGNKDPQSYAGGGGIYMEMCKDYDAGVEPTVTMNCCVIHDNTTHMGGGGVCCNHAPPLMRDCCVYGNTAHRGGGVYLFDCKDYDTSELGIKHILFNDLVVENVLKDGDDWPYHGGTSTDDRARHGGGVYVSNWGYNQFAGIYSTTAAHNDEYQVYVDNLCNNAQIQGANDIFWPDYDFDTKTGNDKGFYDDGGGGHYDFVESDIWWHNTTTNNDEAYPGVHTDGHTNAQDAAANGNIFGDPLFVSLGKYACPCDDYFLDHTDGDSDTFPDSPCVDTGQEFVNATTTPKIPDFTNLIWWDNWYTTNVAGIRDGYPDGSNHLDMGFHQKVNGCSAIDLVSFEARPGADRIVLNWETGTEIDNAGFMLFRSIADTSEYVRLSSLIVAEGGPAYGASYSFVDRDVEPGVAYNYWLVDIDTSGKWTAHGPASARLLMSLKPIQMPATNRQLAIAR
ncbi:MAG: DUF1565 domain-containing protein [Candidatus Coatesbacteria bacterium]|nr:DUF1565 domain-containing protein [Candidatus Coatesbacteria bacterium]